MTVPLPSPNSVREERDAAGNVVPPLCQLNRTYRLGMPQLGPIGLSENWLLKEAGDLHWQALATALDYPSGQIRDRNGNRLYASFVALHMTGGLNGFEENEDVAVHTALYALSSSRYYSVHYLHGNSSGARLRLAMVSIFIRKRSNKDNRSLAVESANRPFEIPKTLPDAAEKLIAEHTALKERSLVQEHGRHTSDLCPLTDFNGAGLLYFANYINFMDRAEWAALSRKSCIVERKTMFYRNVNEDDRLLTRFQIGAVGGAMRESESVIHRVSDGLKICHAFSVYKY